MKLEICMEKFLRKLKFSYVWKIYFYIYILYEIIIYTAYEIKSNDVYSLNL